PIHHNNPLRFNLGELITAEEEADTGYDQDGVNNLTDNAVDLDGQDDGVVLPDFLNHCETAQIDYTVRVVDPGLYGTRAYLNVWFDFNRNGEWGDILDCDGIPVYEWAVQNHPVSLYTYYQTYTSPAFMVYNDQETEYMWVRATLSEQKAVYSNGAGPSSGYADGETEDYFWEPPYDLEVTGMEVSQGIQNLDNEMPLVEGRRTIVRVYVKEVIGRNVAGVNARLYGERDGASLSGSPLLAENNPITVKGDGGDRLDMNDSFWFVLPSSWRSGDVTLRVEVNYDDGVREKDKSDNEMEVDVTFEKAKALKLVLVPLHLHEEPDHSSPKHIYWCDSSDADCQDIYERVYRYHPIDELDVRLVSEALKPKGHPDKEWDLTSSDDEIVDKSMSKILNRLAWKRYWDHWYSLGFAGEHYYGMIDDYFNVGGLGRRPGKVAEGVMDGAPRSDSPWHTEGGITMAHELGHNKGLKHMLCRGDEEDGGKVDEDYPWPYPDCQLADVDEEGYYGLDVYYSKFGFSEPYVISNDPAQAEPNQGFPMMGYQRPNWISPYEYCKLYKKYSTKCTLSWATVLSAESSQSEAMERVISALQNADEYLLVSGLVDPGKGEVTLNEAYRLQNPSPDFMAELIQELRDVAPGQVDPAWRLSLEDANGAVLYEQEIIFDLPTHNGPDMALLTSVVPFPANTHWVRIRHNGDILAEREVSAHAPQVTLLWPNGGEQMRVGSVIRWAGEDADGDALVYTVLYSPDMGQTWRALALDMGETELVVNEAILRDMQGTSRR
ncbi:MAG: hypothetical protein GXP42_13070, partial [Chloroflexi bacterium]|nr:hypothetical protein [Chloroflexota bacterium]